MIKSSPKTEAGRALESLRAAIVDGTLGPGERLAVATLSRRFGLGAMPLRQALLHLTGEGLVESDPHRGARVASLDAQRIRTLYRLRGAVLRVLMPDVVRHASDSDLDALDAIGREVEAAAGEADIARFLPANRAFHHAMHRLGRDPDALEVLDRTWPLVEALRRRHGFGKRRLAAAMRSHRVLLAALRARDAEAATAEVIRSSDEAMEDLLRLEAAQPPGRPS